MGKRQTKSVSTAEQGRSEKDVKDVIKSYAQVHNLDTKKYNWDKLKTTSPRWDFIRTSHSHRATSKHENKITERINKIMAALTLASVAIMVASLVHGYDRESMMYVSNPSVDALKVVGSLLTLLLICLELFHRLRIIRLRLAECGTTLNLYSFHYTVHRSYTLQILLEVLVLVPHPIPFVTAFWANKLGILVFFRLGFCLRYVRDLLPIYNKRYMIYKVPRLLLYANEESFTLLMAVRYLFANYGGPVIICIIVLAGTMFPFALLIAEREAQPDIGYGLWVFYSFNTMTTVGYGDFEAATVLGQVIVSPMMATGLLIGALAVNVLSIWLDTKKQESQVCEWLDQRKSAKDSRHTAALLIQTTWRYNRYKFHLPAGHCEDGKSRRMRLETEAKQARYMRDLRALRLERDWNLLHAFNPLYTDIDTLLCFAQDSHYNTANLGRHVGAHVSTKCVNLTAFKDHTDNCSNPHCEHAKNSNNNNSNNNNNNNNSTSNLLSSSQPRNPSRSQNLSRSQGLHQSQNALQQSQPLPHPNQPIPPIPQSPHLQSQSPQFAPPRFQSSQELPQQPQLQPQQQQQQNEIFQQLLNQMQMLQTTQEQILHQLAALQQNQHNNYNNNNNQQDQQAMQLYQPPQQQHQQHQQQQQHQQHQQHQQQQQQYPQDARQQQLQQSQETSDINHAPPHFVYHPTHMGYLRKYSSPTAAFPPKHIMLLHASALPPHTPHLVHLEHKQQNDDNKHSLLHSQHNVPFHQHQIEMQPMNSILQTNHNHNSNNTQADRAQNNNNYTQSNSVRRLSESQRRNSLNARRRPSGGSSAD